MTGWDGDWPGWEHHDAGDAAGADAHDGGFDPGLPDAGLDADGHDLGEDPTAWTHEPDDGHAAPPPPATPFADAPADHPEPALSGFDGWEVDLDGTDLAGVGAEPLEPEAAAFPPPLDLDVQPPDGTAWADPDLLGAEPGGADGYAPPADPPQALLADLQYADGAAGSGDWDALGGSDDPAVRALAHFWSPVTF